MKWQALHYSRLQIVGYVRMSSFLQAPVFQYRAFSSRTLSAELLWLRNHRKLTQMRLNVAILGCFLSLAVIYVQFSDASLSCKITLSSWKKPLIQARTHPLSFAQWKQVMKPPYITKSPGSDEVQSITLCRPIDRPVCRKIMKFLRQDSLSQKICPTFFNVPLLMNSSISSP